MSRPAVILLILLSAGEFFSLRAGELSYPHDEGATSWKSQSAPDSVRMTTQKRQSAEVHSGIGAELFEITSLVENASLVVEHPIPPARVIDDLNATLAVRTSRASLTLGFRVVLPNNLDPQTGQPHSFIVLGESTRRPNVWQRLTVGAANKQMDRSLQLLRARTKGQQLDESSMQVTAVVVRADLARGTNAIWLDDLEVKGHVAVNSEPGMARVENARPRSKAELHLNRLYLDQKPFFPRILPYHDEPVEMLEQLGFNTVWIPDHAQTQLSRRLNSVGLQTMATPPRPLSDDGRPLNSRQVSLAPFSHESDSVLFWYLGTKIPRRSEDELVSWKTQVSDADRTQHRPILGDVAGHERYYSRHLSMISSSQTVANSSTSYREYRDWLTSRRRTCRPGSFFWTWIDLDANPATGRATLPREPEQLRLQVYTALSAGCRGLGFWTRAPLDDESTDNLEMRLTLAELNRELQILEPLLATGTLLGTIPVTFDNEDTNSVAAHNQPRLPRSSADRLTPQPIREAPNAKETFARRDARIEAALIRSDSAHLLLPVWYDEQANYVPGPMTTGPITLAVPGGTRTASAWLISPTGISNLTTTQEAGGRKIKLPGFNQTAAIVLTSDVQLIQKLKLAARKHSRESALDTVLVAKHKWERVKAVDTELTQLGHGQSIAEDILSRCELLLGKAEADASRGSYITARNSAIKAMELLRILQRAHWEEAVKTLQAPASSPFTSSFQTLPLHWKLIALIGRQNEYVIRSRLASGDFEDINRWVSDGWEHAQSGEEGIQAAAELYPASAPQQPGQYSLRLAAVPEDITNPPLLTEDFPVRVATPSLTVQQGDILHVKGWIRVRFPATDRLDHALVFDNFTGPAGGLRFSRNQDWRQFELVRIAPEAGEFQVQFALNGLGEMQLDGVSVSTLQTRTPDPLSPQQSPFDEPTLKDKAFDLFNRIPGVGRLPGLQEPTPQ